MPTGSHSYVRHNTLEPNSVGTFPVAATERNTMDPSDRVLSFTYWGLQ